MRYLVAPFTLPFMARSLVELILLGLLAGPVSVLVLLRRLAFSADTLTHTVFPGVVLGYAVGGQDGVFWGALVAGLLTAALLPVLTLAGRRVSEDTALAVLLTAMFSLGVVIVSRQRSYTTNLNQFLFGRILVVTTGQVVQTAILAIVVLATLALLSKELRLRAFDPVAAQAMGYRIVALDLVTSAMVALVVVGAVRAVGTVLVIALLIVPAATARLLTERIGILVVLSCATAVGAGYLGLVLSWYASVERGLRLASGATVVLVLVAVYLLALTATPLRRRRKRRRQAQVALDSGTYRGVRT